ncbi:vomeronasal 1 receptor ornAnaV1R3212 [Ornithorhynchus anatinus]|uniref:Vomeronasal type-1 receptor n=1 Tax=Ornithorhynchus anatinus TaxID=9258 RepID=A0A6I8N5V8_ORNAN|nr:vomeronasal 1 receptor ornAnaV1R3212 [Ornithorhynchus anatinus]
MILWNDLFFTVLFIAQTGIGLLGNSILLMLYVSIFVLQPHHKKPIDLILAHLTVNNAMTLLTQVAPGMVLAFRWENSLNVFGFQLAQYIRRVARGLSICNTCLLSVFQAITISPSTSCFSQIKHRVPKYILPVLLSCVFNLLVEMNAVKFTAITRNATAPVNGASRESGPSSLQTNVLNHAVLVSLMALRDILFVLFMSLASGYMVVVLHQHHKQVQQIHSSSISPKSSPKFRATQTILLLVTFFVCFYCINSILRLSLNYMKKDDLRLYDPVLFLAGCYAFFCPLVLISSDPHISRFRASSKGGVRHFTSCEFR